jgi:hypothetical protein
MSALTLPACIITQPVQFEAPVTFPPSIESSPTAMLPLDDIVRIRLDDGMTLPDFEVVVRDPDVDERLEYLVYVDYNPLLPRLADDTGIVPVVDRSAGLDRSRRALTFHLSEVASGLSAPTCHRIELLVSSGFQGQTRLPDREGDLGTAVWWVATQTDSLSRVEMVSCP